MSTSFKDRIRNGLTRPKLPIVLACLAILLALSSVNTGLQFDDYVHRNKLRTSDSGSEESVILDLFSFRDGVIEGANLRMSKGQYPWWTFPEARTAFFRPLAAATHWLDYQLWPEKPMLMHIHSLFWFGVMVFTAAMVYRRMMVPVWVAGLAALLFAVDDAHGIPAGWLANRNVLIASAFVFLCLYLHDRWREDGWRAGALPASACFLLGLLSAEAAIAAGGYIVAYEIFLGKGSWRSRVLGVLPYAVLGIAWQGAYRYFGYGTYGSGFYIDPGQAPLAYLLALLERLPLLLYGQWFFPDVIIHGFLPKPFDDIFLLGAYLILTGGIIVMAPLLKRDAKARFWALGMILALLPVCATTPMNRLLVIAGLGAMGLLAQFLAAWFEKPAWLPTSRIWRGSAGITVMIFILVHMVIAPLSLPFSSRGMKNFTRMTVENPILNLSEKTDIANKTMIIINPPDPFAMMFIVDICKQNNLVPPRATFALGSGVGSDYRVSRIDAHTLEIEVQNGFINQGLDQLYRGPDHPMHVGQQVALPLFTAQVLSLTEDQRPKKVRFTFSDPLEDDSLLFCIWQGSRIVPMEPPPVGQTVGLAQILSFT